MRDRVLIVEDEYIVAADLEARLVEMGYQVVGIAASGDDAVSIASEKRPHIVLMDMRLRGAMNGQQAARLIRMKIGVAIVFVTAFGGFRDDSGQMPADAICLTKPFSTLELRAALEAAVPANGTRDRGSPPAQSRFGEERAPDGVDGAVQQNG